MVSGNEEVERKIRRTLPSRSAERKAELNQSLTSFDSLDGSNGVGNSPIVWTERRGYFGRKPEAQGSPMQRHRTRIIIANNKHERIGELRA